MHQIDAATRTATSPAITMTKAVQISLSSSSHHRRRSRVKMSSCSSSPASSSPAVAFCITTLLLTLLLASNVSLLQPLIQCGALSNTGPEAVTSATSFNSSMPFSSSSSRQSHSSTSLATSFLTNPAGIREWGCQRNETPTIFVHLAKAGGGSNRARFAASARRYNRANWYEPEEDSHFYPIPAEPSYGTGTQYRLGKFCNSINYNHLIPNAGPLQDGNVTAVHAADPFFVVKTNNLKATFEGSLPCNATTPLGLAVACPQPSGRSCMGCDLRSDHCDTVYVGHNSLGSELHWLPPRYLKGWWERTWVHPSKNQIDLDPSSELQAKIEQTWTRLGATNNDAVWCKDGAKIHSGRPSGNIRLANDDPSFLRCSEKVTNEADDRFRQFWTSADYSPIYASMPLLRTTMVREPWSWLGSKFYWHHLDEKGLKCDHQHLDQWIPWAVKEYLLPFCGVDCENRWDRGEMTFEQMALQAEGNLKRSFAVVGLLNETESFYEMVTARIGYLDMKNNKHVVGGEHQSVGLNEEEMKRCKALYLTTKFQEEAKQKHPELQLVERIFQVAMEVNQFQQQELNQCRK